MVEISKPRMAEELSLYENEEEEEGLQVNTLCFSAQTGQRLKRKDGLYQPVP